MALSFATGLLFGVVPAFHSTTSSLSRTLKEAGRGPLTTRGGARMRGALVIGEMALAVMLLAGAGLLIRSFVKLASVDPGFHAAQSLTFELSLPDLRYEKQEQQVAFFDQLMPRLQSIPGVRSAAAVQALPLSGSSFFISFEVGGRPPVPPSQQPAMQIRVATPGYFQTIGIPLKRGRLFTDEDRPGSPPVVLITESAARQYFPNEDAIGKTIKLGWGHGKGTPRAGGEVVGIVGDVKDAGLDEAEPPQLYLPYRQWPIQGMAIVLQTAVPPASVADAAKRAVYATDPNMPVANVRTLEQIVARSISQPRFYTLLLGLFAGVALLLAAIGIFGVLSVRSRRSGRVKSAFDGAWRTEPIGARARRSSGDAARRGRSLNRNHAGVVALAVARVEDAIQHQPPRRQHLRRRRRRSRCGGAAGELYSRAPGDARGSHCRASRGVRELGSGENGVHNEGTKLTGTSKLHLWFLAQPKNELSSSFVFVPFVPSFVNSVVFALSVHAPDRGILEEDAFYRRRCARFIPVTTASSSADNSFRSSAPGCRASRSRG